MTKQELNNLTKQWNKKLRDSGFNDIEHSASGDYRSLTPSVSRGAYKKIKNGDHVYLLAYQSACMDFYRSFDFSNVDFTKNPDTNQERFLKLTPQQIKTIWLCVARGISERSAGRYLNISESTINKINKVTLNLFQQSPYFHSSWTRGNISLKDGGRGTQEFDVCMNCGKDYLADEDGCTHQFCSSCNGDNHD